MTDEGHSSPVWVRKKRRSGAGLSGIIGLIITLLAIFGALTIALGVKEQSLAEGGAVLDSWITKGVDGAKGLVGQAPEAADAVADEAGNLAGKTGDALEAGAEKTADELSNP
ncbi:MAG: hypothetical protein Q8S53_07960 [Brevundimonas sp.]|uniref:hypothetical protein n=1 Tax=Brevundimonas sp. TaxID=1871086 RepID=UPI002732344B|nr:hypothetical protein [Brevundimonas sp.]MDP3378288.1 hypothetical protein [Brevundimonas sp.]